MSNINRLFPFSARLLLGTIFTVFGLNGFLGFLPTPEVPDAAGAFLGGLMAAPYMFPLIKGTEVLVGIALLTNRFVPLALTVLAPISVNIFLFHTVLAPEVALPVLIVSAQLYLAWVHRDAYRGLLRARSSAGALRSSPRVVEQHA